MPVDDPAADPPLVIGRLAAYIDVPHELLVDSGAHTCDATCPPPYVPPPVPWRRRLRNRAWAAGWRLRRLTGLRLVHKDRIDRDRDD